ncbi:hypothetical protein CCAX7_51840 [Capsulimonas corticalis]|uniref:Uncharacterized protein n=1 Tax=Capsulimonas corticalis TaxID=2219043 RepID=A0A402CPB0_9BACT|nr:alpha/beta hydrolase [Capsulimonas corticalis]BDI33133.1 hypothetical protein CCAX7_51840 [Capsulimonas corticalis]
MGMAQQSMARFAACVALGVLAPHVWAADTTPQASGNLTLRKGQMADERWNTPALDGSHLKPETARVLKVEDHGTFTRELVQMQWRPLDSICLYIIKPKNVAKPPVSLFLYNYTEESDRFANVSYLERVTSQGYAIAGFVSALSGDRYKLRPMKEWFVSEMPEALACSAHDVHYIVDYLETRKDLDTNRLGMFGQGSGGAIAVLAAASDPRIKSLDLLGPWGDWKEWLEKSQVVPDAERPRYVTVEFQKKVKPLDPIDWLPKLKGRAIRMQFLGDDPNTPPAVVEALTKAAPAEAEVHRYENTVKFFPDAGGGRLFEWMAAHLKAPPVPPAKTAAR